MSTSSLDAKLRKAILFWVSCRLMNLRRWRRLVVIKSIVSECHFILYLIRAI